MMKRPQWIVASLLAGAGLAGCNPAAPPPGAPPAGSADGLAGTSWELVRFSGRNETSLEPDDRSKYTIAFQPDGSVVARVDCNRGRGTWSSAAPGRIEFGPLALTRAICAPGSLHDRVAADWGAVRAYAIRDGHLFLSLMADGGTYEYEPAGTAAPAGG